MDFAEDFRLPWGKRHALLVVLGYSRRLWVQFYPEKTKEVKAHGHFSHDRSAMKLICVALREVEWRWKRSTPTRHLARSGVCAARRW